MKIYDRNGKVLLDVEVNDSSYRYRSIMQGETVTLYYSLTSHVEIPIGSYIILPSGERYTLCKPENFSKKGTRNFEYTVVFDGELEQLKRYKYKFITYDRTNNMETFELKFSITDKPHRFIELLVENLNLYDKSASPDDKWKVGTCIDTVEKVISFNHDNCYNALSRVASEFNTEWEIEGKTIHIRKVEKFKDDPLPLSYGKGKGFKTGVGRQSQGDKPPVTCLYVQGGERNIMFDTYGSKTLLLPIVKELSYEGRRYKTDSQGLYIMRADRTPADINEDSYDASHIYPKWIGEVTEVLESENADFFAFKIKEPSLQPNFEFTRLPNEKATIIFQSGKLMGREFDLFQDEHQLLKYSHEEGLFTAIKQKEGENSIPNPSLSLSIGDKFAIFNINMPPEYICDDTNEKGASWDMFREAVRYMYENEEEQFSFSGELDGIWAKKRWPNIGGRIVPGGYIEFSDTQFQPEGIRIRITGVKDYINNPHSPEIELSNVPVPGTVADDLGKIEGNEVLLENRHKDSIQYTKRRWYDALETMGMLEEAIDGFEEGIKPIWVQAMSVLVGDESLQFKFANSENWEQTIEPNFIYSQKDKQLKITYPWHTCLVHLTLGGKTLSPSPDENNYRTWALQGEGFLSARLTSPNPYYLYVKCPNSKEGVAEFELSLTPHKLLDDGYYYFLAGTLGSEYMGERSFVTVYGFTEILPGRITVDRIISPDGVQFWDMAHKAFRIGDENNYLGYNVNQDGQLILKGTLVQSPSGDTHPLPVYRGAWQSGITYYQGDQVTFNGSSYYCAVDCKSISPNNSTYWHLISRKGTDGTNGEDGKDGQNGSRGPQGEEGPMGPAITFRGKWDSGEIYYKDDNRVDVVYYYNGSGNDEENELGSYYYRSGYVSEISDIIPTHSSYWTPYGGNFKSVATGLLLAGTANISGWNFNKNFIWAPSDRCVLDGRENHGDDPIIALGDHALTTGNAYREVNPAAEMKFYGDGTMTVGTGAIHSNAGITGEGSSNNSVRFWAGSTFDNRDNARFRVQQDGKLFARDGFFSGEISATKGTFTGEVTVGNLSGWKVPGVMGIYHKGAYGYHIYNTGGFYVSSVSRVGRGHYIIYHNIGHTDYSIIHVGVPRDGDSTGFLGDFHCYSIGTGEVEIHFKDTDNNDHDLNSSAAADLIFLGYAR